MLILKKLHEDSFLYETLMHYEHLYPLIIKKHHHNNE